METVVTFLIEICVHYVLSFPGAVIRWVFSGFKKDKLKTYLNEDIVLNSFVFLVFVGVIVALYYLLKHYFHS